MVAASYVDNSATTAGWVTEYGAVKKRRKYAGLADMCLFIPIAFETPGPITTRTSGLFKEVGKPMRASFSYHRKGEVLRQAFG